MTCKTSCKQKIRVLISSVGGIAGVAGAALWLLFFSESAGEGIVQGISVCFHVLIPSLFPFMVLSAYCAESGLASQFGRWAQPVTRILFRQPGCTAAVILMGFAGGYPAGAKTISRLFEKGELTREQAGRLLCFCVSAGPPFVLTAVASCLLGNPGIGIVLLLSVTLSGLLLGIFTRFRGSAQPPDSFQKARVVHTESPFVSSVISGGHSMAVMCTLVISFSVVLKFLEQSGISRAVSHFLLLQGVFPGNAASLLPFLCEITAGCRTGAMTKASLPLFAFGLGWGGICVHLQIFSLFREFPLSKCIFWLFRFLHGLLSAILCRCFLPFFPQAQAASVPLTTQLSAAASTPLPAAILLFLLLMIMALDGTRFSPRKRKIPVRHKA